MGKMTLDKSKVEEYNDFVASSPQGTLFCTTWWLEAVAPDAYEILTVEKGGSIFAAFPFMLKQSKFGGSTIGIPPLTPWLGILYRPPVSPKLANQLSEEKDLCTTLIKQLPDFSVFDVRFHTNFQYWLPMYWQGFEQTTRYTYIFEELSSLDAIWKGLRGNIRYDIGKAQKEGVQVEGLTDIDAFFEVYRMTFERQNLAVPYDIDLINQVDRVCQAHDCRKILAARGPEGDIHAVAYLVWDDKSAYYLMGGGHPDKRTSGATSLLVWKAIQFAATVTKAFDFEGSMIEPIERFFRAFGATPCPYYAISRVDSPLEIAYSGMRDFVRAIRGKVKS